MVFWFWSLKSAVIIVLPSLKSVVIGLSAVIMVFLSLEFCCDYGFSVFEICCDYGTAIFEICDYGLSIVETVVIMVFPSLKLCCDYELLFTTRLSPCCISNEKHSD